MDEKRLTEEKVEKKEAEPEHVLEKETHVEEKRLFEYPWSGVHYKKKNNLSVKKSIDKKFLEEESIGEKILSAFTYGSLGVLMFGLPIFFTGLSMQGIVFEKFIFFYLFILIALVSWVARGVVAGKLVVKKTPLDLPILAFVSVYALATILSVDRWHSFWGFFGDPSHGLVAVVAFAISYVVIVNTAEKKHIKWYVGLFLSSSLLVAMWSVLYAMNIAWIMNLLGTHVPASIIGDAPMSAGLLFAMLLPLLVACIFHFHSIEKKSKFRKIALSALYLELVIIAGSICVLFNMVPVAPLLIGVGFFLIFVLGKVIPSPNNFAWLPLILFGLMLAVTFTGGFSLLGMKIPGKNVPYKVFWDVMKNSTPDHFFLGNGPATYGYVYAKYHSSEVNASDFSDVVFYQSRGILFDLIATAGVLGAVTFALLMLSFFGLGMYTLARHGGDRMMSLGLFSSSLVILIAMLIVQIEGSMIAIGVLIASLTCSMLFMEGTDEQRHVTLSFATSPKYALALAFVFIIVSASVVYGVVFLGRMYIADLYAGKAIKQIDVSEQGSISYLLKAALFSDQREGRYATRLGQEYAVLANKELIKNEKERNVDLLRGYLNSAVKWADAGAVRMGSDVVAVETLAQVYEGAGSYIADAAIASQKQYQRALELSPNSPVYLLKMGQAKISESATNKDEDRRKQLIEEAKVFFQNAVNQKPNFTEGYFNLALTQEALGDLDGAIKNMETAFRINNSSINYAFNLARLMEQRGKGDDDKIAEQLFKEIIAVDDKEVNAHFNLGLLYEKKEKKVEAAEQYKKVIELLGDKSIETRERLQKMITNLQKGIKNTPETLGLNNATPTANIEQPQPQPQPQEQTQDQIPVPNSENQPFPEPGQ